MRLRRTPARLLTAAVSGALAVALLGACSSGGSTASPSASQSGKASGAAAFKVTDNGPAPAVSGEAGKAPTIAKGTGKPSNDLVIKKLTTGTGRPIAAGDLVLADFAVQKYDGNKLIGSTYAEGTPTSFPVGKGQIIPAWEKLVGLPVGSRIEMVVPPAAGFGSQGNPQANIGPKDTLVFVFDLRGAYPAGSKANGTPGDKPAAGLPTVTDRGAAGPKVTVPKGAKAPTTLSVTRVLKGSGPVVKAGQTIVVQYTGVLWNSGKVFDSSWQRGAPTSFAIGKGAVIKGWDKGLVGAHVGDRLLLVIPPAEGYGAQAQGSIPANSTLVFVVDVIDAR